MILPFVTMASNVFVCSLADRHQAHRCLFLWFLVVALIGYGSYGILPFFVAPQLEERGLNIATWTMICIIATVSTIAMSVITCLSDALAMNSSIRRDTSFGKIRVWGTLGWGLGSLLLSFINQSTKLPLLVPGLIMTTVLILADVLAVAFWPNKNDFELERPSLATVCQDSMLDSGTAGCPGDGKDNSSDASYRSRSLSATPAQLLTSEKSTVDVSSSKIQWELFREVAKRRSSIFVYMGLFTLSGAIISVQWSYFFLFLKSIHPAEFAFVSGFAMTIDSVIEVPFFLLSEQMIQILGRNHTLGFSFASMGARFLLYNYLLPNSSIYLVIIPELLQGPSFGLFYVVMTEVANEYSECEDAIAKVIKEGLVPDTADNIRRLRQSLRATMQSVVSACYEGLGLGLGSILGGLVIEYYGFANLWFYSALVSLSVGFATSAFAMRFAKSSPLNEVR